MFWSSQSFGESSAVYLRGYLILGPIFIFLSVRSYFFLFVRFLF